MSIRLIRPLLACLALMLAASLAQAQSSYKIRPGDTLQLEVLEDASLNRSLLVLPDGSVSVPLVGSVPASGRSIDDVRQSLVESLKPNFAASPTVYLSVGQLAQRVPAGPATAGPVMAIYALGEFKKPGRVDVAPGTSLLQFLAASGGLTDFAATKRIQLRRTDRTGQDRVYLFNYRAVSSGRVAPSIRLQEGDVVIAPQRHLFE